MKTVVLCHVPVKRTVDMNVSGFVLFFLFVRSFSTYFSDYCNMAWAVEKVQKLKKKSKIKHF